MQLLEFMQLARFKLTATIYLTVATYATLTCQKNCWDSCDCYVTSELFWVSKGMLKNILFATKNGRK